MSNYGTVYVLTSPWHKLLWKIWHFTVRKRIPFTKKSLPYPRQFMCTLCDYLPRMVRASNGAIKRKFKVWSWNGHGNNPRINRTRNFWQQYR